MKLLSCLHLVILSFSISTTAFAKEPCGEAGSLNDRIKSCNFQKKTSKGTWTLVTRTALSMPVAGEPAEGQFEVWIDESTQLLWSDVVISNDHSWWPFLKSSQSEAAAICQGDQEHTNDPEELRKLALSRLAKGNIESKAGWKLPAQKDFEQAEKSGLLEALPNLYNSNGLWSATSSALQGTAYLPYLSGGKFAQYDPVQTFATRCIVTADSVFSVASNPNGSTHDTQIASSCGLSGSVAERIATCNTSLKRGGRGSNGKKYLWQLVVRSMQNEVWLDVTAGVLWSQPLTSNLEFSYKPNYLQSHCDALDTEDSHQYHFGGMRWVVPTKENLVEAEPHGMQFVPVNRVDDWFWSSTVYDGDPGFAFGLGLGGISYNSRVNQGKLRCLAEISQLSRHR